MAKPAKATEPTIANPLLEASRQAQQAINALSRGTARAVHKSTAKPTKARQQVKKKR